jgi:hypothetical protein
MDKCLAWSVGNAAYARVSRERDQTADPYIYLAPGVMPHWLKDGESIHISGAPTMFGEEFSYSLTHNLRVEERSATHRDGSFLIEQDKMAYLRPDVRPAILHELK